MKTMTTVLKSFKFRKIRFQNNHLQLENDAAMARRLYEEELQTEKVRLAVAAQSLILNSNGIINEFDLEPMLDCHMVRYNDPVTLVQRELLKCQFQLSMFPSGSN